MNGVPVYPVSENGERPYPEGRKVGFPTPLFGAFPGSSASCTLTRLATLAYPTPSPPLFFFLFSVE